MPSIDRTTPTEVPSDVTILAQDNAAFAVDLYAQLSRTEGNLAFSPYSIAAALGLLYAGADKETASQIAHVLRSALPRDRLHHAAVGLSAVLHQIARRGKVRLSSANGLFPLERYPLLPEFLAVTREYHEVSVTPLDFGQPEPARKRINSWVEERTDSRIADLIPRGAIGLLTRLVLANAIYFKGNWSNQFRPSRTREAPFWLTPDRNVGVATMCQEARFRVALTDHLKVLELPYEDEDLAMLLILPEARDGLAEVESRLSPASLAEWCAALQPREVEVLLPRFQVECGMALSPVLESLGIVDAFDQGRADFSRMDGRRGWLYVGSAIHKAFVDANEEGTEAAAATGIEFTALLSGPLKFHADHPFLFALVERRTNSILFLGRVVDPRSDNAAAGTAQRKGIARWLGWIRG